MYRLTNLQNTWSGYDYTSSFPIV